jgi:hypothetical protein
MVYLDLHTAEAMTDTAATMAGNQEGLNVFWFEFPHQPVERFREH